jgi:hypothetical protein
MAEIQNMKISNVETLEIRITSGRRRYFFTEISDLLKGKKIVDIVPVVNNKVTPSGNATHPVSETYLTLSVGGKEKIKDYPLTLLNPSETQIRPSFNDLQPDWSKSYLNVMGDITDGASIVLSVMFND